MPAMAATVVGHSGVGKTESIIRALNCYPKQVLEHETFPQLRGKHKQVVWLSVDVPQSGRLFDLITNLMASWDSLLLKNDLSARPRFEHSMPKRSSDMARAANEWLRVATAHFLGILHLDEVQNFFKIDTLKSRRNRANGEKGIELSIAEDGCLKWILMLINTWGIPVVFSGTPDGIGALTKRMSTAQRTVTCGYHHMTHFTDHKSKNYEMLLRQLLKYQYVDKPLRLSNELAEVVLRLSGGVPRIIVALWVAAQRMALERSTDELKITDFLEAASTLLAPLAPAVDALRSNDPRRMSRYEDLVTGDKEFWGVFWNSVAIS
jgi:hypothetical protein